MSEQPCRMKQALLERIKQPDISKFGFDLIKSSYNSHLIYPFSAATHMSAILTRTSETKRSRSSMFEKTRTLRVRRLSFYWNSMLYGIGGTQGGEEGLVR